MATEHELNEFLKSVERRAFKRALYHVRDEEAALDLVQDAMIRLASSYGDKGLDELQLLFQRILSNAIMDWFRRQKTHNAVLVNFSEIEGAGDGDSDFSVLESMLLPSDAPNSLSAERQMERTQIFYEIEKQIGELPQRQREAFLLRYWEDMDVTETAQVMGCTVGSVKTHCFRAVQALAKALTAKGIRL
ncbi:MAG: RNA polymerase sigma factor [Rhodoferax sp.]